MKELGLFEPTPVELVEARGARPIVPRKWPDLTTMTVSYGHGLSASPLHLAAAYSTMVNGGTKVTPTLLRQKGPVIGTRVISAETSAMVLEMMRQVVVRGTASFAEVAGYPVGGKTGTADKPDPRGGYFKDRVIATFASAFTIDAQRYVLVVTLDEPVNMLLSKPHRTAGWTAVPVAAEITRRVAPLLGLRPKPDLGPDNGLTLARN